MQMSDILHLDSEINDRDESIFLLILTHGYAIGALSTVTFSNSDSYAGWEDVMDITFAINNRNFMIENCKQSFSDHRQLYTL